jgi:hypothetical protein
MTRHYRTVCKHGIVLAQCRCPAQDKPDFLAPCPPDHANLEEEVMAQPNRTWIVERQWLVEAPTATQALMKATNLEEAMHYRVHEKGAFDEREWLGRDPLPEPDEPSFKSPDNPEPGVFYAQGKQHEVGAPGWSVADLD